MKRPATLPPLALHASGAPLSACTVLWDLYGYSNRCSSWLTISNILCSHHIEEKVPVASRHREGAAGLAARGAAHRRLEVDRHRSVGGRIEDHFAVFIAPRVGAGEIGPVEVRQGACRLA